MLGFYNDATHEKGRRRSSGTAEGKGQLVPVPDPEKQVLYLSTYIYANKDLIMKGLEYEMS